MTTNKDREWTLCFVETLKANGVNMSDFTLEIIDELMKEHRANSAEQARKESAERVVKHIRETGIESEGWYDVSSCDCETLTREFASVILSPSVEEERI